MSVRQCLTTTDIKTALDCDSNCSSYFKKIKTISGYSGTISDATKCNNFDPNTYTITEVQEGSQIWTTTVAPATPNYTFTISNLVGDSDTSVKVGDIIMYSYYRYTVLSVSSDGTTVLTGNRTSIRGGTGAASTTYSLIVSNLAIIKDKNGTVSPTSITLTAKYQTGSSAMANYSGRFKIETTTNNSTWTTQYTSSANEATKDWTVIDGIVAIRCNLYLKDGTTTLLDQQTIAVISDGIDGTNITITSTSVTYQEGTSGTVKPTGTWGTAVPTVAQGNYLWTKTSDLKTVIPQGCLQEFLSTFLHCLCFMFP